MIQRIRSFKVWVVYGYNESEGFWDEIDFSIHYRKIKWVFRNNKATRSLKEHGYTKFVCLRRNASELLANRLISYKEFYTTNKVYTFLKRLKKYERATTYPNGNSS